MATTVAPPSVLRTRTAPQSLIGVFLMATFLVCLARKFGRA